MLAFGEVTEQSLDESYLCLAHHNSENKRVTLLNGLRVIEELMTHDVF